MMAKFQVIGFDAFAADLEAAKSLTKDEQKKIIQAGANTLLSSMAQGLILDQRARTGGLLESLRVRMKTKGGTPYAQVGPGGKHHVAHGRDAKGRRGKGAAYDVDAAEVGFVLEYGAPSRNISATHWMENAVEITEKHGGLSDAMQYAFNEILETKGVGQ